jgi:hypothetical protein
MLMQYQFPTPPRGHTMPALEPQQHLAEPLYKLMHAAEDFKDEIQELHDKGLCLVRLLEPEE